MCLYVAIIHHSYILEECCMMEPLFECVCVQVNNGTVTKVFASVYRPPKGNMLEFLYAKTKTFDYVE